MKLHKSYILPISLLLSLPAAAQFNQSISVEGKYVPEIFRLDRINTFPKAVRFTLESTPLSYDSKSVPTSFAPTLLPLPATGWRDTRAWSQSRGYVELGAGSWLNSTLSAGYRFISDPQTTFGFRLQHNSTSLWRPKVSEMMEDTKQYRYDETLGFYASHDFDGRGRLSGAIDWHIGNFNYYGYNPMWLSPSQGDKAPKVPTQTLNDIAARFIWQSPDKTDNLTWSAEAGVRYFGYRSAYDPIEIYPGNPSNLYRASGGRETDINLAGSVNLPLSSGSSVGVDADINILLYGGDKDVVGGFSPFPPDNYGMITLTPYYRFTRDRLNVRVGADIDLSINAGDEGDRYSFLHVAPDIKIDYLAGPAALYLHLLGGSRLHTLAAGYQLDYYQTPWLQASRPVYTPLDGSFGASFGPFAGFSLGIDFAFRVSRGEYLGGWYQQFLNLHNSPYGNLPREIGGSTATYTYSSNQTLNMHGYSLGAHLSYDLGKILKVNASANYQPQNGQSGYFNGYDRPRWIADFSAETNPWRGLKLKLAYNYRGVRNIYTIAYYRSEMIANDSKAVSYRLPDLCSLNFGASYSFTESFNIWVQGNNLLNRHDDLLPGLPQQGLTVTAGFGLTF